MKKLLMLLLFIGLLIPFSAVAAEIKPLPKYSLEGVSPKVYYYEWDAKYHEWCNIDNLSDAKGIVMKKEVFIIDRNKDGVVDLKIFKYYWPEGKYENYRGKKVTAKAHVSLMVMVDDDLDKLWDRRLYDGFDAFGNLGMDGVFEEEEIVEY